MKVSGTLTDEEIEGLQQGVELDDGLTAPALVKKSGIALVNSWVEMTIYEGRKHQIKRMLEAVGHRVLRLRRIRFGPLWLGDLPVGACRYATDQEANALRLIGRTAASGEEIPAWKPHSLSHWPKHPVGHRFCSPRQRTR